jgi:hypothetical protein
MSSDRHQLSQSESSAGKRFKNCIIHIGTIKTGTKTIQDFLCQKRKLLRRHGVLYPYTPLGNSSSQWEFVAAAHPAPWTQDIGRSFNITDAESHARFKSALSSDLTTEFARAKSAHTLLISSEHLQSRLVRTEDIFALKEYLSQWTETFEIVVYFRRQDRLALSFLSTRLKSHERMDIEQPMHVINRSPHLYDYASIYDRWAGVFGESAMSGRVFQEPAEGGRDLISDFCGAIGLAVKPTGKTVILNRSLNQKGFHFLVRFNKIYPIESWDGRFEDRVALIKTLSDLYTGKFFPISRVQAEAFYSQFSEANETLRARAFPHLPKPLFDEDFSEYPEHANGLNPTYDDAVEITARLWQHRHRPPNRPGPLGKTLRRLLARFERDS